MVKIDDIPLKTRVHVMSYLNSNNLISQHEQNETCFVDKWDLSAAIMSTTLKVSTFLHVVCSDQISPTETTWLCFNNPPQHFIFPVTFKNIRLLIWLTLFNKATEKTHRNNICML